MRVVIADDSIICQNALRAALQRLEHDVVGVGADGREAEALCSKHMPDLAILDMSMGAYGGDLAAPECAKMGIIVLLASSRTSTLVHIEAQGLQFLPKPITYVKLKKKLEEMGLHVDQV